MSTDPRKLIDVIKDKDFTYSYEVTPDVNVEELSGSQAEFYSITWHAKIHQCKDLDIKPLQLAKVLRKRNQQVLMHLSCDFIRKHYLERVLAFLQEIGVYNLFLVLGESYESSSSDFQSSLELISYIRSISGRYFCIGVAGFSDCSDERLLKLKEKIDAGADFILTQAFFEANNYDDFSKRCKNIGINVPIIPGIFVFENFKQLQNFTNMCKVKVSDELLKYVQENEGKEISGANIVKKMIQKIKFDYPSAHFHFFTLNKIKKIEEIISEIKSYLS